jgi:ammonia channel protein AmtB
MLIGAVAGLVTITPACGFVDPTGAFFIGLIAGNNYERIMMIGMMVMMIGMMMMMMMIGMMIVILTYC